MMPASPVPRYRPASPITFAPDPRTRPISPILFAKSSSKGKEKKRRREASKTPRDVGGSGDMYGDNEYGIGTGDNGGGYEEDDEWDTADEGTNEFGNEPSGGSTIYPKRPQINTSSSRKTPLSASTLQTPSINTGLPSPSTSKYNTASSTYTLVRFSTGQKLEDEYQLSWYDLASHEILELHAHAPVQHLPASFGFPSPDLNAKSEHARSRRHARTESSSSLSHQISRTHAQAPSTECDTAHTLSSHTYFPVLDRTTPSSYVQPYWEGYVRALRVVWREESTLTAHHVYGGRSGGIGEGATGGFVPAFAVMGYDPSGRDFRAFETREGGISAYAAEFAGSSVGRGKGKSRSRSTRLEWRLRWAIVRDGMLYLSKDREVSSFFLFASFSIMPIKLINFPYCLRIKRPLKLILYPLSQHYVVLTTWLLLRTFHNTKKATRLIQNIHNTKPVTRVDSPTICPIVALLPRFVGIVMLPPWIAIIPTAAIMFQTWIRIRMEITEYLVCA